MKDSCVKKVLISVLGKGQYNKVSQKNDYTLTKYALEDYLPTESKLVSDILAQRIRPDEIFIVGTSESLWEVVDAYLPSYKRIDIPYGVDHSEFWKMFDILIKLDVENSEIYFDITHGFRSIPIFLSTILNFFKNVKNAKVKGVYYGIFEAQKDGVTPVINMLPFLDMNDWIDSFTLFRKYSDGRDIAKMIKERFDKIPNREKKRYGKLQNIASELDFYSRTIGFSAVEFYENSLHEIRRLIDKLEEIPPELHASKYLMTQMKEEALQFDDLQRVWQKHLKAAELLFEKNRYAQSLTLLREVVHTYLVESVGKDYSEFTLRETALNRLFWEETNRYNSDKETKVISEELYLLFEKIKELRNKSNHAFIKKSVGKSDIKKSVENLELYLKKCREIFENNRAIKDQALLKKILDSSPTVSKRLFLLFSHTLTEKQKEDAARSFGVTEFISMPKELQHRFANIPPDAEDLRVLVKPFEEYLYSHVQRGDYVLIQGDVGVVYKLVKETYALGAIPLYATTKRDVVERIKADGSVVKQSIFKHVRFRKYEQ